MNLVFCANCNVCCGGVWTKLGERLRLYGRGRLYGGYFMFAKKNSLRDLLP